MLQLAFTPARLGRLALPNRFIKTATFEGRTPGGRIDDATCAFHAGFAAGGVGLTTVAYCAVAPDARTFPDQLVVSEASLPALTRLADAVHAAGGAVSGQLAHCGGFTKVKSTETRRPKGPSFGLNDYGLLHGVPFAGAMDATDIARTVRHYARAATLLKQAGFDALEIHMGHGYLLSQFISPATNRRRDGYGGSLANRMRLPLQVLAAVREAVGEGFPLLAKINLDDGVAGGGRVSEAVEVARLLEAGGIDALVLSGGLVNRSPMHLFRGASPLDAMIAREPAARVRMAMRLSGGKLFPNLPFAPLYFREQALRVRDAVGCAVAYLGGVTSGDDVAQLMRDGFDYVCVGRALLHDAAFVQKLAADPGHVSACSHCNLCVATMSDVGGTRCALVA
ncbi:NADH:flavin oxidoreductase [Crenobacter sp. SG2303]|uniref:NADH:flavin oxidoreductase n=1 Tax=Crenobacter oryzisoli TaxID=3056844 RepID=A0ABT7XJF1_9NEIS|nr:NADH:flavin oxidoreductase [Crenobacter sp. SG2303]MDN0073920.1 NADH:flavin oxidoreductase [Crenobacter sp. SG2303]